MSGRRIEMWKLLYNLVGQDEMQLNNIFDSVSEIFCNEPSLLQSYSLNKQNNVFQDTFIQWLINKLTKYLIEDNSDYVYRKNIKLQEKLLSTCFRIRPMLFKTLINCYFDAVNVLAMKAPKNNAVVESESVPPVELNSFTATADVMYETIPDFGFDEIRVPYEKIENCIQAHLLILRSAVKTGCSVYTADFVIGLGKMDNVILDCSFKNKLLALHYAQALCEFNNYSVKSSLPNIYHPLLCAVASIWEVFPYWLSNQMLTVANVEDLIDSTIFIINDIVNSIQTREFKYKILQIGIHVMIFIIHVQIYKQPVITQVDDEKFRTLNLALVNFGCTLQVECGQATYLQNNILLTINAFVDICPEMIRFLIILLCSYDPPETTSAVFMIFNKFTDIFKSSLMNTEELKLMEELLVALIYLERQGCKSKQNKILGRKLTLKSLQELHIEFNANMFAKLPKPKVKIFGKDFTVYFQKILSLKKLETTAEHIKVLGLILESSTLRTFCNQQLVQKCINFMYWFLNQCLNSSPEQEPTRYNCVDKVFDTFCKISVKGSKEVETLMQKRVKEIAENSFCSAQTNDLSKKLCKVFSQNLINLVRNNIVSRKDINYKYLEYAKDKPEALEIMLKVLVCTADLSKCFPLLICPYTANQDMRKTESLDYKHMHTICTKCTENTLVHITSYIKENNAIVLKWHADIPEKYRLVLSKGLQMVIFDALVKSPDLLLIGNHFQLSALSEVNFITELTKESLLMDLNTIGLFKILTKLIAHETNVVSETDFLGQFGPFLLKQTINSLRATNNKKQIQILQIIGCVANSSIKLEWLFHFFKMSMLFMVHANSTIVHEAILKATEMCAYQDIEPIHLWSWYKRDALNLVVRLAAYNFLTLGVRLTKSVNAVTKMLGFSCAAEFICKYHRLLTTFILPLCIKEPRCKGLIVQISIVTQKPIDKLFFTSFLRIYSHIYLTEDEIVVNKCVDLIVKCTGSSLQTLMNTDVKQTVSEFLIYFNRNPQFVMKAFQCLLFPDTVPSQSHSSSSSSLSLLHTSNNEFAKFIADRFLGVLTYFETCISDSNFEKPLKEESLYSLGQIIRFVGSSNVTQFRFKIIAMLCFVLSLSDKKLQTICLKVWKIFIHNVNIEQLGPSLSHICASLQPLLQTNKNEVNAIYEFILKNDSLLGAYIPDLYFMEDTEFVSTAVRQCISRQTEALKTDKTTFIEKVQFYYKQLSNENLLVRIQALISLRKFLSNNRQKVNDMVLSEICVNPLIVKIVDILIAGCRHEDNHLQLLSGKCLSELGAIDPSYLCADYTFQQTNEISLSIHTDSFAIMALTQLCRSYQFQKNTKYVDNFSLAIQETLSVCGVSPNEGKKLNVWEALPLRMRQVMGPLLSSCYINRSRDNQIKQHPLFNSHYCRSYEDWAFLWVSRLIGFLRSDDTKHLLSCYIPSMRRDLNTLVLFFPYVLLHALQECNPDETKQIYEEFEVIFRFCYSGLSIQTLCDVNGIKEFYSTKYSASCSRDSQKTLRSLVQYEPLENIAQMSTKLCSELIDFLQRWLREWQRTNQVNGDVNHSAGHNQIIEAFIARFDKHLISKANYTCGEFARALFYLEQHIEEEPEARLQEQIPLLIEIYGSLMDADSVEGAVFMKKTSLSLSEEILFNRIVDRPQELMTCYEQILSDESQLNEEHIRGMINCYLRVDTPETALLVADGLWHKLCDHYTDDFFKECKVDILWRLGSYDELEKLLEDSVVRRKTTNWNIQCAETFLLYRQPNEAQKYPLKEFMERLDYIRSNVLSNMRTCSGVKQNSYPFLYDEVVKLHLLNEVEKSKMFVDQITTVLTRYTDDEYQNCIDKVRLFFDDWEARLCVMPSTIRIMEPVICFRRNLLIESKRQMYESVSKQTASKAILEEINGIMDEEIGKLWIRSVQMNRDGNCLQQAQQSIMKAIKYQPKTLFIEKAKLYWQKGDQTHSFKVLVEYLQFIEQKCNKNLRNLDPSERILYAEAKFLQATYNAASMNICSEQNIKFFREAISGNRHSEKCYAHLAQYLEKITESFKREQVDSEENCKLLYEIMINYAKSLKYGFEYIYQSLPRLLSIWLDTTSRSVSIDEALPTNPSLKTVASRYTDISNKMNELINGCVNILPTSVFYTAFSQILSRLCHPSMEVFKAIRTIIIKLITSFPQQSLWMLLPTIKSSHTLRLKRCQMILKDNRLNDSSFHKLLNDFSTLVERLIELTNKEVPLNQTHELNTFVNQLSKLFEGANFSEVLLPFEKYMQPSLPITATSTSYTLQLPNSGSSEKNTPTNAIPTNPFPYTQIYICSIKDNVTVLRSAARPKKISFKCSDGKCYDVMLKPKDDLRKDFRLMEFNGLVKRYLHQEPQARQRRLRIRTYAVIPFNEECGLVEWLPNLHSFRAICSSFYRSRGLGIPDNALRQYGLPRTDPIEKKRNIFLNTLVAKHPPVFHEWFRQRFVTPQSWYEARSSYVKTIAVMSMVGYILGLGDRHGENVLFDETNGDAVHVDFNCLFNQGETFAIPELVPFRLTQNMVFAMGPLGIEGMFRKCAEIALRVLKQESETLMSVLRPFVYDLIVLNRNVNKKVAELTDPKATLDVKRIEERLKGYVKKNLCTNQINHMPLSVEGQVSFLISEAMDIDNLASMYIGWGAYL
ncbi:serine/threonine-protein kinase ATR [Teleopsis dalmanni]|uniref:serine/threonine-protein kinase ATR n=1 Tax=Teleopsis dalmanni TaxID=139649 RepID=UPI0018CEF772|nr:serine/threonine-protein kinase ATR [Teleopsis dalmanni]